MQVIKPGILVSLKSSVNGGVAYDRQDIEKSTLDSGAERRKILTVKVVQDPQAHERAMKARSKARQLIAAVCTPTAFGLIYTKPSETELDDAIAQARALVSENNDTNATTRVSIYCLRGRIASTDEEAARAISSEVSELLAAMNASIGALDVEGLRAAATRAKQLEEVLSDEKAAVIGEAIEQARKAARTIVKRIQKDGEDAAKVLQDIQRGALEKARIAFLDLDDSPAETRDTMPVTDVQRIASLDVGDEDASDAVAGAYDQGYEAGKSDIESRAASAG